jgi:hypothetical protein
MIAAVMLTGIGCLAAYWQRAAQQEHPLFAPSLFAVPTVSIGLLGNLFSRLGGSGVPFLIPLMLQLKMGYSPSQAGMMMLPLAGAGMLVKRFATWSISRYGYRYVLVANTVAIGAMIASFSLMDHTPMWLLIPQLALFGACNSLQFTGMNSLALSGLQPEQASSGNGLLSMVQMLAIGLGVALANESQREPALITFLVTASGISFFGIGAACWGLVFGVLADRVLFGKMTVRRADTQPD